MNDASPKTAAAKTEAEPGADLKGRSVALVLGAGGARGLAHIGVIEALLEAGCEIKAIAGSSMGALVGGIHALGRLDEYRRWIEKLSRSDMLVLIDWTLSGGGLIRGQRLIEHLREMVGDADIEDLPMRYTAVATDLDAERELWLDKGPLFDAIRASIAIPGVFTPHRYLGRTLVDGGLLNPLPVTPILREVCDLTIAVNVNAAPEREMNLAVTQPSVPDTERGVMERLSAFLDSFQSDHAPQDNTPGLMAVLLRSLDTMQGAMARYRLASLEPDLIIELPRDACMVHEFFRARELIKAGKERAEESLQSVRLRRNWR